MRLRQMLSAKIHRATVTEADVNYVGSITIDQALLERVDMLPGELVHVWNVTNGERLRPTPWPASRGRAWSASTARARTRRSPATS